MFEYLMPLLFLPKIDDTLLSNTYENAVKWQKKYAESRKLPWGFSESGYAVVNLDLQYQYRAFGVPGLGLKRGLAEDYVVAPYSSMLALMVWPEMSLKNLRTLKKEGAYSLNGFYESIDYTARREPKSDKNVVRMYMAHHQGMSLLAVANVLKKNVIQNIFHSNPLIQSCELLLQERIPRGIPIKEPRPIDLELEPGEEQKVLQVVDHAGKKDLEDAPPRTHVLSNGAFSTVITHAGTGFSSYNDKTLTRWRSERVKDAWGFFFYIKDLQSGEYWSSSYRPVNREADRYDSWFHAGTVQTARVDEWIETFTEICVSPEDNIELRKIKLTNYSDRHRKLEITSYAEVVLNHQQADAAHPAFSNLFVQTEHIPEHHALMAKRRPRSADEQPIWLVHTLASDDLDDMVKPLQYETDREKFIGRGRSLQHPAAMDADNRLSGSVGNVPDPIVSMRRIVELGPGETQTITFGLGTAMSVEEAIAMADEYDNPYATDRTFELAAIYGRVELDHIGISGEQAHYFQKLCGALLYGNEQLRASKEILEKNRRTQSGLWAYGISGDWPILLYRIRDVNHLRYLEQLLKAHMLWRLKGIQVDFVILYEHPPSYIEELRDAIHRQIQSSSERHLLNKNGGIFVIHGDDMPMEDRILLETVAVVYLQDTLPKLDFSADENGPLVPEESLPLYRSVKLSDLQSAPVNLGKELLFYNGYGGFSPDGKEYIIHLTMDEKGEYIVHPPAPWINVIANKTFGFITSERGSDYTWSLNSRENRLTPWSNDSVVDPAGEALYVRNETHGLFWSPLAGPTPGSAHYEVHHGFGYTQVRSETLGIKQEVTKWVDSEDPVKIIRLRLTNTSLAASRISVFYYLEWVLGVFRESSSRYVTTRLDDDRNAIIAQNYYNNEFAERVAFVAQFTEEELLDEHFTADRNYFIGKNRGVTNPRALCEEKELKERFGAGFDPCGALQAKLAIASGASVEVYFILGEADNADLVPNLIEKYKNTDQLQASLENVKSSWAEKLERIQISTPAPELDILFNGWLQYQNIACRMWGRSGFYQSGGAYGFRDQLQDASAALYADPNLAREQILLHAAHQFPEGDVLHWWHPPSGRGIRSRITDDLLWLPYITAFYHHSTADKSIFDEEVAFISARPLEEGEHEAYVIPEIMSQKATIYEHCCRAIDRSLTKGSHNLPLIGGGDWNDGLNRVGEKGQGESIWLGFFLYAILTDFIPICKARNDQQRLKKYSTYQENLLKHLNKEGWDGEWYRRAYYDDGTPLGSKESEEAKIDAIAQAWAVISGAAPPEKATQALESARQHLVSPEIGIIKLLTPAFDQTEQNPGYIKGYIPGVRENGGQYTHAALWLIKAFAEMNEADRATELLKMITPINHSNTKARANRYKVEPYAVAADIYSEPPLNGMGGWTWYTGSAGWMYRTILESILGIEIVNKNELHITPPPSSVWQKYSVIVKSMDGSTRYKISVSNKTNAKKTSIKTVLDGELLSEDEYPCVINMKEDGKNHLVYIEQHLQKQKDLAL